MKPPTLQEAFKRYLATLPLVFLFLILSAPFFWHFPARPLALKKDAFKIQIKAEIESQQEILSPKTSQRYKIEALFKASPKPFQKKRKNGLLVDLKAEKFSVFNQKGQLVISFENQENMHRYRSELEERLKIYEALAIDPKNQKLEDDVSLFCESVNFYYQENGQICEINFSERLKKALKKLISSLKIKDFIEQILADPQQIPPLFNASLTNFSKQAEKVYDQVFIIDRQLDNFLKPPFSSHLLLRSHYDKKKKSIQEISITFKCSQEKQLFGQKTDLCYTGRGEILFF